MCNVEEATNQLTFVGNVLINHWGLREIIKIHRYWRTLGLLQVIRHRALCHPLHFCCDTAYPPSSAMANLRPVAPLLTEDLSELQEGRALPGTVVDAYFRLIERRALFYPKLPTVHALGTTLLENWRLSCLEGAAKRTGHSGLTTLDMILLPLTIQLESDAHYWSLVIVHPKEKIVRAYDPLGRPLMREMLEVKAYLDACWLKEPRDTATDSWILMETPPQIPHTSKPTESGLFVCVFGERVARNASLKDLVICPTQTRRTITRILRKKKFGNEDFSLLEGSPATWYGRYSSPARLTPRVRFQLPSPEGEAMEVEEQDDALLRALDKAIRETGPVNFPPLTRTIRRRTTAEVDPPNRLEDSCPASPCLSLEASDLEDMESPDLTPPEVQGRKATPRTTSTVPTLASTPQAAAAQELPATYWKGQPPHRSPGRKVTPEPELRRLLTGRFPVPEVLRRRACNLRASQRHQNRRWRVFRRDGSYFRTNPRKLINRHFCF